MSNPTERFSTAPADDSQIWEVAEARDLTGRTLGDFRVDRLLGRGGMGEVYLAHQISLDRPVALKVLKPSLLSNPTSLGRFESEAWAVAKLNHPNIVHVYALGEVEGIRYIAMEYVQGTNLRDFLAKKGVPDLPVALAMMRQAGLAVHAAGEAGLVHRDIKPDNLLLTRKGQLKVADFGLARGSEPERLNLTQTGVTLGTPLYMSPEQAQGHALDHRSDLYSLGITFYHLLAGFPPFKGETGLAVALKHIREAPVNLAVHRPDLPAGLSALVMKLIEKDPAKRHQTAQEMLRDLAKVREAVQAASLTSIPVPTTTAPVASAGSMASALTASEPSGPMEAIPGGIGPGPKAIALCAAAGLAIGGAIGWFSRPQDLLGPSAPVPTTRPGLWLAAWKSIPREKKAETQYQKALLRSDPDHREAAWLAVPGYFPDHSGGAIHYDSRAYVQLIRHLLRRRDRERLEAVGAELARSKAESDLAGFVDAAVSALEDDGGKDAFEQLRTLWKPADKYTDPARIELMLEIALEARRTSDNSRLKDMVRDLVNALLIPLKPEEIGRVPDAG